MRKFLLSLALFTAAFLSAKVQKQTLPVDPDYMDAYSLMEYYYPQEIYGDLKLDSIAEKSFSDEWQFYCIFDANGRLVKVENFSNYRFQVFFTYDKDGFCVQSVAKMPNMYTVSWEDVQKAEYKRDAKGRATEAVFSVYSDGKWQPAVKYEDTYDAHDNCTLWTDYDYQTDLKTWKTTEMYKSEYTYNAKGLKTQCVYSYWYPDAGWTMDDKDTYEYDAQGRETLHMDYNWDGSKSNWVQNQKIETAYSDPNDKGVVIVLKHTQRWNSSKSNWESYSMDSYEYTNGKETWYRYGQMENSKLVVKYTRTTTYNSKGQVILKETEYTSGKKYLEEYMYDDFGNLIALQKTSGDVMTYSMRWYFSVREGIDEIFSDRQNIRTRKVLHNGQLYIIRNDKIYNVKGVEVE